MPITQSLLTLLKNLDVSGDVSRGKKVLNPKTLLRHLAAKHEEYSQATQQDAHEVLRHLIDGVMMEEVDVSDSRSRIRAKGPAELISSQLTAHQEGSRCCSKACSTPKHALEDSDSSA